MIKHILSLVILLSSLCIYGQDAQLVPDQYSKFRFIGDTTTHYTPITIIKLCNTVTKIYFYKAEQNNVKKVWTKHYGYVNVWWVDYTTREWKNRWMMGVYWTYVVSTNHKEVIFYDINQQDYVITHLKSL